MAIMQIADAQSRKTLIFLQMNNNVFSEIMIKTRNERMEKNNERIFRPPPRLGVLAGIITCKESTAMSILDNGSTEYVYSKGLTINHMNRRIVKRKKKFIPMKTIYE